MKRLIANGQADIEIVINLYIEEVEMEVNDANELVASLNRLITSNYIDKLIDINPNYQVSDKFLDTFNDLIENTLKQINDFNFKLTESYKSTKGYSYYIRFTLPDGKCKDIGFRISTHKMSNFNKNHNKWKKEAVTSYDFRIGGKSTKSIYQVEEIIKQKLKEFKEQN